MRRYRPGDHVVFHFSRYELIRIQFRAGSGLPPAFEVLRVLPAGEDGQHSYQVRSAVEPYARVAKEYELAPVP